MANLSYYEKKVSSLQTCRAALTLAINELDEHRGDHEVDRLWRDLVARREAVSKGILSTERMLEVKTAQLTARTD